jgi:hypothetical protein
MRRTDIPPVNTVWLKKPTETHLDVQVHYEQDARVVYLRDKVNVGPLLSHMHPEDVVKIFPVYRYAVPCAK